jgi:glycosyltransferase involved in cell wall biosynthesis
MIYVIAADSDKPMGGVMQQYRLAESLLQAGHQTAVMHSRVGFSCTWFEHQVPLVYERDVTVTDDDLLVVPDEIASHFVDNAPCPYVMFNQNPYLFMESVDYDFEVRRAARTMHARRLLGVIVVSESSQEFMRYAFPDVRTERIRYCIDGRLFRPREKTISVSYMPRKSGDRLRLVVQLLELRGAIGPGEAVAIENVRHRDVRRLLSMTKVFLSGSELEGFGLPVAEALASGAVVVGYDGEGGRELFRDPFAIRVDGGDVLSFAEQAERVIRTVREEPATYRRWARLGREFVLESYSRSREVASVEQAFDKLFATRNTC